MNGGQLSLFHLHSLLRFTPTSSSLESKIQGFMFSLSRVYSWLLQILPPPPLRVPVPPIAPFSASQPHAGLISAFVISPPFAKVCLSQGSLRCNQYRARLVSQAYALTQSQRQSKQSLSRGEAVSQYAQHSLHNPSSCFILILCSHLLQSTLAQYKG